MTWAKKANLGAAWWRQGAKAPKVSGALHLLLRLGTLQGLLVHPDLAIGAHVHELVHEAQSR